MTTNAYPNPILRHRWRRRMRSLSVATCLWVSAHAARAQAPTTEAPLPVVDVPLIGTAAINAPLLVAKLRDGTLTPEAAWQQGLLKEDDLLYLLGQPGGDMGASNLVDGGGLASSLVALLVKQAPHLVSAAGLKTLSAGARYRVGAYFFTQNEPRAQAVLAELVEEAAQEKQARGVLPWYHPLAATRLGEWYQNEREYQKALEVFTGALAISQHPNYVADWTLQVARTYALMGDEKNARQWYEKVPQYGNGWFTGLAFWDQARHLMQQGKHVEARKLLEQPVTGENAYRAQVALHSLMGYSFYQTQDFDSAHHFLSDAIARYESLKATSRSQDLQEQIILSQELIRSIRQ